MIDNWVLALWAFVFLNLGVLIYIFGRRSVPSSYTRSRYVIGIKLKMVIAFVVPVLLVGLVFGVAYLFGGLVGLLVPLLALVLVLEGIRAYARSESSYVLSTTQSPRLHEIARARIK